MHTVKAAGITFSEGEVEVVKQALSPQVKDMLLRGGIGAGIGALGAGAATHFATPEDEEGKRDHTSAILAALAGGVGGAGLGVLGHHLSDKPLTVHNADEMEAVLGPPDYISPSRV